MEVTMDYVEHLPLSELRALREKYSDNADFVKLVDAAIERQEAKERESKIKADFEAKVSKLTKLPEPPAGIHNIFMRWAEVDVPDGEPETVDVPQPDGTTITKTRQPSHKEYQWIVETNKAFQVTRGTTDTGKPRKLAITVLERNGQSLETIGNFRSGAEACDYLDLDHAGNSGIRVLRDKGFIIDPYDGEDFTIKN